MGHTLLWGPHPCDANSWKSAMRYKRERSNVRPRRAVFRHIRQRNLNYLYGVILPALPCVGLRLIATTVARTYFCFIVRHPRTDDFGCFRAGDDVNEAIAISIVVRWGRRPEAFVRSTGKSCPRRWHTVARLQQTRRTGRKFPRSQRLPVDFLF